MVFSIKVWYGLLVLCYGVNIFSVCVIYLWLMLVGVWMIGRLMFILWSLMSCFCMLLGVLISVMRLRNFVESLCVLVLVVGVVWIVLILLVKLVCLVVWL